METIQYLFGFHNTFPSCSAMKIHEVLIEDNLVVKKKNLPTDAFYKMVNIRESRRKVAAAGAKNDSDFEYDDIVDSDY